MRTLLLAVGALSLQGCGMIDALGALLWSGGIEVKNDARSAFFVDEVRGYLEWTDDPDIDEEDPIGIAEFESRNNMEPGESEDFGGLHPGHWFVVVVWGDDLVQEYEVHLGSWDRDIVHALHGY